MKEKRDFGLFIQQKRKEKGLTQLELADKLYVTESAVSKWERGLTYPDITLITSICEILDINEHEFITASNDTDFHRMKEEAKRFKRISNVYFWLFTIMYLTAILTCFIVNLAVNHQLSWFFIVFFGCLLGFSLVPSISRFVKKYRLLIISGSVLVSLWLLLATCALYTNGTWFFVAMFSTLFTYVIIFIPIMIKKYKVPSWVKKNNAIVSLTIDVIFLFFLLIVCAVFTNGNWIFVTIASIFFAYVLIFTPLLINKTSLFDKVKLIKNNSFLFSILVSYLALLFVFMMIPTVADNFSFSQALITSLYYVLILLFVYGINKLYFNKMIKTGLTIALVGFCLYFSNFIISLIYNVPYTYAVNFSNWNGYIDGNIYLLLLIAAIITALVYILIGILSDKKNKQNKEN